MKKILIPLLMGMLCTPVVAEDIGKMMEELGYSEPSLLQHIPKKKFVPKPPKRFEEITLDIQSQPALPTLKAEDFLQPRVFARSESAEMIPFLLKLQKQNPTSAKITRKLAVTCLKNGQPREALYWYIQTYQRDRSDSESLWNMAAVSYQLGDESQTRKYLQEYAAVDPNSAWGRMAKDFLKGRFSGTSMEKGFDSEFSRFGHVTGGNSDKKGAAPVSAGEKTADHRGIMIIEGKRTTLEQFVEEYETPVTAEPATLKDTVKEKSGKKSVEAEVKPVKGLDKAKIVQPAEAEKVDLKAVTTVAEPLAADGKP